MHGGPTLKKILKISVFFAAMSQPIYAQVYPWVEMDFDDLKMITDPYLETQFRLEMIENAQNTIDVVIWDQRTDETVGLPLLRALRKAADRGIKVRFLLSWSGHIIEDTLNYSGSYLTSPPTSNPIEFQIVGGSAMWKKGWGLLDGIHEKLFIVDNRITLITGRGHADQYLRWMDTAFTFKGPLVEQTIQAFQNLWDLTKRESNNHYPTVKYYAHRNNDLTPSSNPVVENSSDLSEKLAPLHEWLLSPAKPIPSPKNEMSADQILTVRLLHFDLLHQLKSISLRDGVEPHEISTKDREFQLEDPIVNEVIRLVSDPTVKDLKFYTLSVNLNPSLKETLIESLKRGLHVTFFTNGKDAQKDVAPLPIPVGWYLSLPDMDDLMSHGAHGIGLINRTADSAVFLHRKMAIIDDIVLAGSHNLNYSSSFESDEINIEIDNHRFAEQARALFDTSILKNGNLLDPHRIRSERKRSHIAGWFAEWFKGLY